ncbi:Rne/Rng family ribonuclease [Herbiconiux liukaitaii]|uniref:Rne/Rng family ribonuclease n=1 Tax=Herbiconiux liukaitaii TaxID=3342799 RepID=UPI0035BA1852
MVERISDTDNGGNNGEGGARRKRLFGGRRGVKKNEPQQPEQFEAEQVEPEQFEPDQAGRFDAEQHDDEPGLAPFTPAFQAPPAEPVAEEKPPVRALSTTSLFFQAPDLPDLPPYLPHEEHPTRERGERSDRSERGDRTDRSARAGRDRDRDRDDDGRDEGEAQESTVRRRSRRRSGEESRGGDNDPANTVIKVRTPREPELITEPQRIKGSTRLEAKKQRRRDGRDAGRRRPVVTEAEFLARREAVDRVMVVRAKHDKIQIGVLEDGVLVEHYVAKAQDASLIGNVYLGRVQNVLPSMEAAFVDIGRGRNAVLYSGEVDWEAAAAGNTDGKGGAQQRRIELALKSGDTVLVQVTKDPVGHKGARLTSQVSLPGRYLVYVPNGSMNGISRKLPDTERARLKRILKEVLPENVGVIVRTASEGATEEQLTLDVNRLTSQWAHISEQVKKQQGPHLLHSEPDLLIKIVRDVFNEDFHRLVISGDEAQATIENYLAGVAPDLLDRVEKYEGEKDAFDEYRISEQIEKALDRKVWLPSGGSLVIDRTEAMTVVDVNTGKFVGSGGNLEETVTKNNLEAAEEIVRQLRLRDIGGIIVVDFIDMVLETNRDLVLRRMIECLSRDRTKHQVAEVTSLGLVQMTRKKLGLGLLESFSEPCETCAGRGIIVHHDPVVKHRSSGGPQSSNGGGSGSNGNGSNGNGNGGSAGGRRGRGGSGNGSNGYANGSSNGSGNGSGAHPTVAPHAITDDAKNALAQIAASTIAAAQAGLQPGAPQGAAKSEATDAASAPVETAPDAQQTAPEPEQSAAAAEPQVSEQSAPSAEKASTASSRRRKSRHSKGDDESKAASAAQATADPASADPAPADPPAIEILDIPVTKVSRAPRVTAPEASHLLDSVLDALPEPKQPGQGRSRSRRVSTAAVSAPVESPES